jgi:hypothetical protein
MRLCWLVEHGGNPSTSQVKRGGGAFSDARAQSYRHFPFLEPPASRGELTVVSVLRAQTPEAHAKCGREWGQSVWQAWAIHHAWAREMVAQWFQRK